MNKKNTMKDEKKKGGWRTPVVTRIELNPEQAVLSCECYGKGSGGSQYDAT